MKLSDLLNRLYFYAKQQDETRIGIILSLTLLIKCYNTVAASQKQALLQPDIKACLHVIADLQSPELIALLTVNRVTLNRNELQNSLAALFMICSTCSYLPGLQYISRYSFSMDQEKYTDLILDNMKGSSSYGEKCACLEFIFQTYPAATIGIPKALYTAIDLLKGAEMFAFFNYLFSKYRSKLPTSATHCLFLTLLYKYLRNEEREMVMHMIRYLIRNKNYELYNELKGAKGIAFHVKLVDQHKIIATWHKTDFINNPAHEALKLGAYDIAELLLVEGGFASYSKNILNEFATKALAENNLPLLKVTFASGVIPSQLKDEELTIILQTLILMKRPDTLKTIKNRMTVAQQTICKRVLQNVMLTLPEYTKEASDLLKLFTERKKLVADCMQLKATLSIFLTMRSPLIHKTTAQPLTRRTSF